MSANDARQLSAAVKRGDREQAESDAGADRISYHEEPAREALYAAINRPRGEPVWVDFVVAAFSKDHALPNIAADEAFRHAVNKEERGLALFLAEHSQTIFYHRGCMEALSAAADMGWDDVIEKVEEKYERQLEFNAPEQESYDDLFLRANENAPGKELLQGQFSLWPKPPAP